MGILFDSYVIFKPAMDSVKELRHITDLPHGLDVTKGGLFHTMRKFAVRAVDGSTAATDKNAFIFTKKDGLEYFASGTVYILYIDLTRYDIILYVLVQKDFYRKKL